MVDEFLGVVSWPTALVAIVIFGIWGFNVHADRENLQELRMKAVEECAYSESPKTCVNSIMESLESVK